MTNTQAARILARLVEDATFHDAPQIAEADIFGIIVFPGGMVAIYNGTEAVIIRQYRMQQIDLKAEHARVDMANPSARMRELVATVQGSSNTAHRRSATSRELDLINVAISGGVS